MSRLAVAPEVILTLAVVALLMVDVQWRPGPRWWALCAAVGLLGKGGAGQNGPTGGEQHCSDQAFHVHLRKLGCAEILAPARTPPFA